MLLRVTWQNRAQMLPLLLEFFQDNQNIDFLVKQDAQKNQRLLHLAEYVFDWGMRLDALYWLKEQKGFALLYNSEKKLNFFREMLLDIKLISQVITWSRVLKILKRRWRIVKIRNKEVKNNKYLYFYALGIQRDYRGLAQTGSLIYEVKKFVNDIIAEQKLPMFVETVSWRNKRLYEAVGFVTYAQDIDPQAGFSTWFLKREQLSPQKGFVAWT